MLTRQATGSSERQAEIMLQILSDRTVRIKELATRFSVSEMTIRRELDHLADIGQVERIHGGARLRQFASEEASYHHRAEVNASAKGRIALAALDLIDDGDTVGLDASTSALSLARLLPARKVTAILTGLDAVEAIQNSSLEFYVCGGYFHARARSFVGGSAVEMLQRLHPDKVFFSCNGFTPGEGFSDPNPQEAETKRALLAGSAMKIALIDHSKFGRRSLASTARTEDVDVVITDAMPPTDVVDAFQNEDVRLIIAPQREQRLN